MSQITDVQSNIDYKAKNAVDGTKYKNGIILLLVLTAITFIQPSMIPLDLGGTLAAQLIIAFIKMAIIVGTYMHFSVVPGYLKAFIYTVIGMMAYVWVMVIVDNQHRDMSMLTAPKPGVQHSAPAAH